MNALGTFPSKPSSLRKRVRNVISEVNSKWGGNKVFPGKGEYM
jgi:hypothetical protein